MTEVLPTWKVITHAWPYMAHYDLPTNHLTKLL